MRSRGQVGEKGCFHQVRSTRTVRNGSRLNLERAQAPLPRSRACQATESTMWSAVSSRARRCSRSSKPTRGGFTKGKAGTPVEFGVPVCVIEDNPGLHPAPRGQGSDQAPADDPGNPDAVLRPSLVQLREQASSRRAFRVTMCCRETGRDVSSPRAVSIRRWNRRSTFWNIGTSTGSAPSEPMALPARWRFPSRPSTPTASACCCAGRNVA